MTPCKLHVQSCKLQTGGVRLQRRYQNTLFSHLLHRFHSASCTCGAASCRVEGFACRDVTKIHSFHTCYTIFWDSQGLTLDSHLQLAGCRRSLQSGYYKAVGSRGLTLDSHLQLAGCRRSLQSGYYKAVGSRGLTLTLICSLQAADAACRAVTKT